MALVRTALGTSQVKSGTSVGHSNANAVAIGDLIIVIAAGDTAMTSAVYRWDASPANEQLLVKDAEATNSGNVITSIWSGIAATAGASNVYVCGALNSTSDAKACAVIRITGHSATPFDVASAGTGSSLTANSGATTTTAQAEEILIGALGWEGPGGDNVGTASNSFTLGQRLGTTGAGAASNITIQEIYRIVSATGAYTAEVVRTADSRDWAAAIATYKGPAPVALPFKQLLVNQAVNRLAYY